MNLSRKIAVAGLAILSLAMAAVPAMALLVQPVLIKMSTSGSGSSASIEVVNDRAKPVTVEVTVNRLTLPERGAPVQEADNGDEFQIFPVQAIIPAGGRQIFRVRWIGDPAMAAGKLYMFSTSELPISLEEGQSGVSLYYAVESVVAVSPAQSRSEVSLASVERWTNSEGKPGLLITFENDGAAIGYVTEGEMNISIAGSDWNVRLQSGEMNAAFGLGVVPAAGRRAMFLPRDDVPAEGELSGRYIPQPSN